MNKSLSRLLIVVLGIACMPLVAKSSQAEQAAQAAADKRRKETREKLLANQPHIAEAKKARDERYARQLAREKAQKEREMKEQQEQEIKEKEAQVIQTAVMTIAANDQPESTNVSKETTVVEEGSSILQKIEDDVKQSMSDVNNPDQSNEGTGQVVVPERKNEIKSGVVTPRDFVFGLPLFCHYAIDKYLAQYASIGLIQKYLSQTDAVRMGIQAGVIGTLFMGTGYLGYRLYKKYVKKQPARVIEEVVVS